MTRKFGEKSYNPGVFRLDFWGDWNHYNDLFRRKLPGSLMLAAYDVPMTAEELSIELGVAMPYLEDELELLLRAGVMTKSGERYRTSLVILTEDYECELARSLEGYFEKPSGEIFELVRELLPEIRGLDFTWRERCDNELLWMVLNIVMLAGYRRAGEYSPIGKPKPLALGGNGFIFGNDNDYKFYHFSGICMRVEPEDDARAWFSAENYTIIKNCQHYSHDNFRERMRLMISAIFGEEIDEKNSALASSLKNGEIGARKGRLIANFPVFTEQAYERILELSAPAARLAADCMIEVSERARVVLEAHVPDSVREQCADIAKIHHRIDVTALLIEQMVGAGRLFVPNYRVPLCIFGVKK